MSQSSIDDKSKSSSENEVCSFSDSEEDNPEFFNKQILFESGSTKVTDKDKSDTALPKASNQIEDEINKAKTMTYTPLNLNRSEANILEKDKSFNDERDIEIKNTCSFITRDTSPKKKTLSLSLLGKEKTKIPCKKISLFEKIKHKKEPEKPVRKDKNGTEINKKNKKKVKITFNTPFEDVEYIESFKKFNVVYGIPKNDYLPSQQDKCQCCQIW